MTNKRTLLAALLVALLALWTAGCEDDGIAAPSSSQIVVTANPGAIVLDPDAGMDTAVTTISATVFDMSGIPLRDVLVTFSSNGGTLGSAGNPGDPPTQIKTNDNGVANDTLTVTVTDPDTVEVTAASATVSNSVMVTKTVVEGAIFLNANPTTIILDPDAGIDTGTSTITAQITDSQGAPLAGQLVTFTATGGTLASQNLPGVITNANGIANDTLTVNVNDPLNITVGATFSGLFDEVSITTTIIAGNQLPTAVVVAVPVSQTQIGSSVTFDGRNSSDPDGIISCYQWEIVSSMLATEIVQGTSTTLVTRSYADEQDLTVTLRVSDDPTISGQCQPTSPPLNAGFFSPNLDFLNYNIVCDTTPPLAAAGPNQTVNLGAGPVTVTVDGGASSDAETGISDYRWDCADGMGFKFGETVDCVYSTTGTFSVQLLVTNGCGDTDNDFTLITVNP